MSSSAACRDFSGDSVRGCSTWRISPGAPTNWGRSWWLLAGVTPSTPAEEPQASPRLTGTVVFIGAGRADSISPPTQVERLAEILRQAGADVAIHWEPGGHQVSEGEVAAAREWLARVAPSGTSDRG